MEGNGQKVLKGQGENNYGKKKIIILTIICMLFNMMSGIVGYAENTKINENGQIIINGTDIKERYAKEEAEFSELTQYGIIQENEDLNGYVSRYKCVVMVLKLCGLSHEKSIDYSLEELYKPLFADESENGIVSGYLRFAKYNGIAYGVDEQFFEPNRNATYAEAVAFAMRINGNKTCDRDSSLDILYDEAYELQIIDETMYNKRNDDIICSDWCEILINTMNTKCVVDAGTGLDYENMTYRDILIEMNGNK